MWTFVAPRLPPQFPLGCLWSPPRVSQRPTLISPPFPRCITQADTFCKPVLGCKRRACSNAQACLSFLAGNFGNRPIRTHKGQVRTDPACGSQEVGYGSWGHPAVAGRRGLPALGTSGARAGGARGGDHAGTRPSEGALSGRTCTGGRAGARSGSGRGAGRGGAAAARGRRARAGCELQRLGHRQQQKRRLQKRRLQRREVLIAECRRPARTAARGGGVRARRPCLQLARAADVAGPPPGQPLPALPAGPGAEGAATLGHHGLHTERRGQGGRGAQQDDRPQPPGGRREGGAGGQAAAAG